jgi:signal transduction histidine kinase
MEESITLRSAPENSKLIIKQGIDNHSLRSSLSGIISTVELIEKHHSMGNIEECLKRLDNIKSIVRNVIESMDVSQDYSTLSEVSFSFVSYFDLRILLEELVEKYEIMLKDKQSIKLDMGVPELQLFQNQKILCTVVSNLIQNAIKYSPEGATIGIRVDLEDRLKISIYDEGIGIPDEEKQSIFKKYYRASNTEEQQGRGVGLYQVKNYMNFLNGCITVHDNHRQGSVFTLYLDYSLRS